MNIRERKHDLLHEKIKIPRISGDSIYIHLVNVEEVIDRVNTEPHDYFKKELQKIITSDEKQITFEKGSVLVTLIFLDKTSGLIIDLWRHEINDLEYFEELINAGLKYFNEIKGNINKNISFYIFIELIPEKIIFQGIYYIRDLLGYEQDLVLLEIFRKNTNEQSSKFLLHKESGELIEYYAHPELADIINRKSIDLRRCMKKIHEFINNILAEEEIQRNLMVLISIGEKCHVYTSLILQID
ncbi:MAG: hypothetical protein ACP5I7_00375 [Sulfolobales archaeon]